jgi:hypothetical protein
VVLVALLGLPALSQGAVAVALVVLLVERVQLLMLAGQAHFMVAVPVEVQFTVILHWPAVALVQSALSGPVIHVHFPQQIQVTCNELIH